MSVVSWSDPSTISVPHNLDQDGKFNSNTRFFHDILLSIFLHPSDEIMAEKDNTENYQVISRVTPLYHQYLSL